jgi:hypothetical protein
MSLLKYRIEKDSIDWWYVEFRENFYRAPKKQYKIRLHDGSSAVGEGFCFPGAKRKQNVEDLKFDFYEPKTESFYYIPFSEIDKIEHL